MAYLIEEDLLKAVVNTLAKSKLADTSYYELNQIIGALQKLDTNPVRKPRKAVKTKEAKAPNA